MKVRKWKTNNFTLGNILLVWPLEFDTIINRLEWSQNEKMLQLTADKGS